VTLARKVQLRADDLRIETCRSNFNILMWNFYVCAPVGILIKYFDYMHGATIRIFQTSAPVTAVVKIVLAVD